MRAILRRTAKAAILVAACLAMHVPARAEITYQCSADRQWAFNKCLRLADARYQKCMWSHRPAIRCRAMRAREQRSCHKQYCTTTAPVRRTR